MTDHAALWEDLKRKVLSTAAEQTVGAPCMVLIKGDKVAIATLDSPISLLGNVARAMVMLIQPDAALLVMEGKGIVADKDDPGLAKLSRCKDFDALPKHLRGRVRRYLVLYGQERGGSEFWWFGEIVEEPPLPRRFVPLPDSERVWHSDLSPLFPAAGEAGQV